MPLTPKLPDGASASAACRADTGPGEGGGGAWPGGTEEEEPPLEGRFAGPGVDAAGATGGHGFLGDSERPSVLHPLLSFSTEVEVEGTSHVLRGFAGTAASCGPSALMDAGVGALAAWEGVDRPDVELPLTLRARRSSCCARSSLSFSGSGSGSACGMWLWGPSACRWLDAARAGGVCSRGPGDAALRLESACEPGPGDGILLALMSEPAGTGAAAALPGGAAFLAGAAMGRLICCCGVEGADDTTGALLVLEVPGVWGVRWRWPWSDPMFWKAASAGRPAKASFQGGGVHFRIAFFFSDWDASGAAG